MSKNLPKPAAASPPLICLWPERLLFVGPLGRVAPHRHAAVVLVAALEGEVRVRLSPAKRWQRCGSVLIPAGLMHELDLRDHLTAVFYNDPHRPYYPLMSARERLDPLFDPLASTGTVEALATLHAGPSAIGLADRRRIEHELSTALGRYERMPVLDPRVSDAIAQMQADLTANLPLPRMAEAAGISASRLQHLFQAETGVPLRRFRLWIRFRRALERIGAGTSLTTAAFDAGFASSTHFSHAFKAMFGVSPASVLANARTPRIHLF
jgi:AraC-like DNA-binding protein